MPVSAYPVALTTQKGAQLAGRGTTHARFCVPGSEAYADRGATGPRSRRLCPHLRTRLRRQRRKVHNGSGRAPLMPVSAYPARQRTQKGAQLARRAAVYARACVSGSADNAGKCTTCVAAGVFATADAGTIAAAVGDMAAKTLCAFTAVFVRLICNRIQKRTMCKQKCPP